MVGPDRLSALDAAFLDLETPEAPLFAARLDALARAADLLPGAGRRLVACAAARSASVDVARDLEAAFGALALRPPPDEAPWRARARARRQRATLARRPRQGYAG